MIQKTKETMEESKDIPINPVNESSEQPSVPSEDSTVNTNTNPSTKNSSSAPAPKKKTYNKKKTYPAKQKKKVTAITPAPSLVPLNIGNKDSRSIYTDIYIPVPKNVIDKSPQFTNVLSREHFYSQGWQQYIIYKRWVGMISNPIQFRRGLKASKHWQVFFERLFEMENDVYISNFVDASPDIVTVQIVVFEPKYLQIIDGMIGDCLKKESLEFLKKLDRKMDMFKEDMF